MPKYFGVKVSISIDCFGVFIEIPSNLLASAKTWSNYKHHNTVKYLIGITPQGAASFLSKGWGGRVSDKYLTENRGMLSKLLVGDIVWLTKRLCHSEKSRLHLCLNKDPCFY